MPKLGWSKRLLLQGHNISTKGWVGEKHLQDAVPRVSLDPAAVSAATQPAPHVPPSWDRAGSSSEIQNHNISFISEKLFGKDPNMLHLTLKQGVFECVYHTPTVAHFLWVSTHRNRLGTFVNVTAWMYKVFCSSREQRSQMALKERKGQDRTWQNYVEKLYHRSWFIQTLRSTRGSANLEKGTWPRAGHSGFPGGIPLASNSPVTNLSITAGSFSRCILIQLS